MKIVLVTETIGIGGAEIFALRLCSGFRLAGEDSRLFVLRKDLIDWEIVRAHGANSPVHSVPLPLRTWLSKIDGLLFRLNIDFSLVRWLQVRALARYLRVFKADIVHSHLITTDLVVARACRGVGIPWVTTMHGDYFANQQMGRNRAARIQDFSPAFAEIVAGAQHLVCITEAQRRQLESLLGGSAETIRRVSKIYNGYPAPDHVYELPKQLRHIPPDALVFGMVARGIPEKGWDVLVAAFEAIDLPNAWLVLVGEGEGLCALRSGFRHERIVFTGNVVDPLAYVARFDVGCLPSRYSSESLPTSVIEYLAMGKPVIASKIGEIPTMIQADTPQSAGLLIEFGPPPNMIAQLTQAMTRLYEDAPLRAALSGCARLAFQKFDMSACIVCYRAVYENVLS